MAELAFYFIRYSRAPESTWSSPYFDWDKEDISESWYKHSKFNQADAEALREYVVCKNDRLFGVLPIKKEVDLSRLSESNDDIWWDEQDIKEHLEWFGSGMAKSSLVQVPVSDLFRGLTETSANPVGNYKTTWIMILRREPGKCKLPRGFGHLSDKQV